MKTMLLFVLMLCVPLIYAQSHDDFEDGIPNPNGRTTQGWRMGASPKAVNIPGDTTWATLPNGQGGASDNYMVLMPDGVGSAGKLIVKNTDQWIGDFTTFTNISIHVNNLTGASNIDLRMAFRINGGSGTSANSWVSSTNAISISSTPGWNSVTFPVDSNSLTALGINSRTAILSDVAETRILDASSAANWRGDVSTDTLAIDNVTLGDTPLAVELIAFSANKTENGILLEWDTASELDNAGFKILRSVDRHNLFAEISSYQNNDALKGAGTTPFGGSYSYEDKTVSPGKTYWYKLQDVDFEGRISNLGLISATVMGQIDKFAGSFNLLQNYPNPFNPSTKIELQIPTGFISPQSTSLIVYNSSGQKVKTLFLGIINEGLHTFEWDGRNSSGINVASGIYIYRLQTGNQVISK